MREILFRGKRLDNGEWVEGYLLKTNGYLLKTNGFAYIVYPDQFADDLFYSLENIICAVDPTTVGQFTGLMANGKRIFEGDKLLVVRHKGDFKYHCVVRDIRNLPELMFGSSVESIEVIGNIHDSELLEVTPNE